VGAGRGGLGALYDPFAVPESTIQPGASLPSEPLAEEKLLGDIRDLATTAQTAMVSGQVENPG
jgi:hypothetical protein